MFNPEITLPTALRAGIPIRSGALRVLTQPYADAHGPTPPQVDAFDLMAKATT